MNKIKYEKLDSHKQINIGDNIYYDLYQTTYEVSCIDRRIHLVRVITKQDVTSVSDLEFDNLCKHGMYKVVAE